MRNSAGTVLLLSLLSAHSEASLESQCVVKGTEVNFHCHNEESWAINHLPPADGTVTFIISNETGQRDDMYIIADQSFLDKYGNVSLIKCEDFYDHTMFATLAIADTSQPQLHLFPELTPDTWTTLSLEWLLPGFLYAHYNFTVTWISVIDGEAVVRDNIVTPEFSIELEGYECEEIVVEISLSGNCEPERIAATLLLDPPYPIPQNLMTALLNSTSFALTWDHPETWFYDDYFNYSVRAVVVSTGEVISDYIISLSSTATPWEEFDFRDSVETCQMINFTLSLVRDCRVLQYVAALPIYPLEFSTEKIQVEVLFTAELNLQKIEVSFMPPFLCPTQTASYTLTFTTHDSTASWSTESKVLTATHELVVDVVEPERFQLEMNYTVTVTIATALGNVSSSAVFNICTLFGGAPRDLTLQSFDHDSAVLSWSQLCGTTTAIPVTYKITAELVSTGTIIHERLLTVVADEARSLPLQMEDYACKPVNYTVSLYGYKQSVSIVKTIPAYPIVFTQDVEVDVSFNNDGNFKEAEVEFNPPRLCEFQSSHYVLSYTDGNKTWSSQDPVFITDTSQQIKEKIATEIEINTEYTVTVTVLTDSGNLSSSTTFNLCTFHGGAPQDLLIQTQSPNKVRLSWRQQCSEVAVTATFTATAVLVGTGAVIDEQEIVVAPENTPQLLLNIEGYECRRVNYSVRVQGYAESVSVVEQVPAYPTTFTRNVSIAPSLNTNGEISGIKVLFTPPKLCEFQNSSYVLSYSDGDKTWSSRIDPVPITDTRQQINEEIVFGIEMNREYTITVTVFNDFGSLSSSATIKIGTARATGGTGIAALPSILLTKPITNNSIDIPVYTVVAIVVATLVCGFTAGGAVLYCLRQGKRRREKLRSRALSAKKSGTMVRNPLYEAADDHYEHLPDCNGHPLPSLTNHHPPITITPSSNPSQVDITPQLPPPRKENEAGSNGATLSVGNHSHQCLGNVNLPESLSLGGVSAYSGEDCYTIMSPAGTLTALPRITTHPQDGTGVFTSNGEKCLDGYIKA